MARTARWLCPDLSGRHGGQYLSSVSAYELAELNIARLRAPIDSDLIREFVAGLDHVHAVAEQMPGFVWRQKSDEQDYPIGQRRFGGEDYIYTLTTWESLHALASFVFESEHVNYLRRRRDWFHRMSEPWVALWWVKAGHRPDSEEADEPLVYKTA
jgi:hypothetical protein